METERDIASRLWSFFVCVCVKHYNSFFAVSTKKKKKPSHQQQLSWTNLRLEQRIPAKKSTFWGEEKTYMSMIRLPHLAAKSHSN